MNLRRSKTLHHKPHPVDSVDNLRDRVARLFAATSKRPIVQSQFTLGLPSVDVPGANIAYPSMHIAEFLDFITDAMPEGDIYLFGGVLRDLALLGRSGFNSDIDTVVEGDWANCVKYLDSLGARKNKFGGYRLVVAGWPVDIWNAKETWAIKSGFVQYKGIASLTETTVLNWDAILMNWRTRSFIYRPFYFEQLRARVLDIVLEENPNPLGMAVRVFRHLCLKDARQLTKKAALYLAECTKKYDFNTIKHHELESYGNTVVEPAIYRLFEHLTDYESMDINRGFGIASDVLKRELGFG